MKRSSPRKVTRSIAAAVRRDYRRGASYVHLADLHQLSASTIGLIVQGRHQLTEGMANLSRGRGRPCHHDNPQARRRCIHAQLAGQQRQKVAA